VLESVLSCYVVLRSATQCYAVLRSATHCSYMLCSAKDMLLACSYVVKFSYFVLCSEVVLC